MEEQEGEMQAYRQKVIMEMMEKSVFCVSSDRDLDELSSPHFFKWISIIFNSRGNTSKGKKRKEW